MTDPTIVLPPGSNGNGSEPVYRLTMMVPKRQFRSYLRERWWVVLVCTVVALATVLIYETLRPPAFISTAQLYLSGETQPTPTTLFADESQNYFGTQIELLKSARLQGIVYERLGIAIKPGQKPPIDIAVVQPLKTSLLNVRAVGSDPLMVQQFLQKLISEYLAYKKETRLSSSEDILISINEQVARKEKELQAVQERWTEFRRTNNVAVLEEEGKSAGLYLADLNLQLAKLRMEQEILHERMAAGVSNQATRFPAADLTTNSVPVSDNALLASARVDLALLLAAKKDKIQYLGEQRFQEELNRQQQLVAILESEERSRKSADLADVEKRISLIEAAIPSWEVKIRDTNERLAEAQRLKDNIQREQGYYDHLLTTLQNVDLNKNVQQERLAVLQPATTGTPEKRSLPLRIVLALIAGPAISLGIIGLWHLVDDRFVSVRDVKDQFGEPLLGLVPRVKSSSKRPHQALLAVPEARPHYLESYLHLRSALLLSECETGRPQTLLFTSAMLGEGTSTVAINLGRVLARGGLRVVVVNLDPHSDDLHHQNGAESRGVFDYLRGEADLKGIIHPTELDGLNVVRSGIRGSEESLLNPRCRELMEELRTGRDFVIFDSAPILASDDTALLVPYADAVILVTRAFYGRSRSVRQALDMLYQRQAKRVNLVFNAARADDIADYHAANGVKRTRAKTDHRRRKFGSLRS